MDVRLLGPVDVELNRQPLGLGGPKQRAVLSLLALNANATVSVDALIEGLWGEEQQPASAAKNVQLYVSQLRKLLGGNGGPEIVTRGRGYELRIDPESVDALRFERLVGSGGSEAAHEALALWRGAPFADLADEPFAGAEARRLEDLHMVALELAIEGDLEAGRHMESIGRLEVLVAEHPLRERLHGQLMLALYRAGRQAEALDAYRAARESLVEQVGVEPGPDLRRLHEAILHQDPELELRPLDAEGVREIARVYLGERADDVPMDLLLEQSGGLRARAHDVVAEWARRETAGRVEERAGDTEARRGELRELEAELASDVVELGAVWEAAELHAPAPVAETAMPGCPFKGLASFDASDADYFFGRERLVAQLVARLVGTNLLGIVGASGSGKSSALHAGLLPALANGVLPGSEHWRQALLRPGEHPPAALRRALEAAGASEDRLVIAVDQFEEVFTASRNEPERIAFVDALVEAARRGDGRVVVVVALRADYYGACAAYPELSRMLGQSQVLVGPMGADELARAIDGPARRSGLVVEPALVERLVGDVAGQPGALPLLSTALLELWERRDGRRMTLAAYEVTGGVEGAVARLAERAYGSLTSGEQATARRMLLRLAGSGDGDAVVRRRVSLDELDVTRDPQAALVLDVVADSRLVTVGEDTAEVAHEALLREWPRLRGWLEEDAEGRRLHRHVSDAARDWDAGGRDASELYRGARLAAAHDWAAEHGDDLNRAERDFLDESRVASQREADRGRRANRRLRGLLAAAAAALAIAVVAGLLALDQRGDARGAAITADAQRLGALALNDDRLDHAMLLARTGVDLDESATTRGNLLSVLLRSPAELGVLNGEGWPLYGLAVSPDGRLVATGDERGGVMVFDARTRRPLGEPYRLRDGFAEHLRFSPDGKTLAVIGHEPQDEPPGGLIDLIDPRTRERRFRIELPELPGASYAVSDVAFLPNGRDFVTLQGSISAPDAPASVLRRVNGATGAIEGKPMRIGTRGAIWLHAPGDRGRVFATSKGDDRTYEIDTRRMRVVRAHPAGDVAGAVSRDGRLFALGSQEGGVRLLDLRTGRVRDFEGENEGGILRMEFTPDARKLVTVGDDGGVLVWDVAGGAIGETLPGHGDAAWGLEISSEGRTLYTAAADSRAIVWDLGGDRRVARPFDAGPPFEVIDTPRGLAASPDGRTVAISQSDGTVDLVDARTLEVRDSVQALRGFAAGVAYSPDGRRLAVTGESGEITLWNARTLRRDGAPLEGLKHTSQAIVFSPNGRLLAAADAETGPVRVWDLRTRSLTKVRLGVASASIAFSPDGKLLAAAGYEDPTEVRDARSGRLVARLETSDTGRSVAWSPGGRLLATGQYDGRTQLWSTGSWRRVGRPLEGHTGRVTSLEFTPGGSMLTSAAADGTVRLWDVSSQRPVGSALTIEENRFVAAVLGPGGRHLFAASDGSQAIRFEMSPGAWKRQACVLAGRELSAREWSDVLPGRPYRAVCRPG